MIEFSDSNIITRNYCYSPSSGASDISVDHSSGANVVSYNICEGATNASAAGIIMRYDPGQYSGGNLIYGNTIYNCARGISYNDDTSAYGNTFKNNIVLGSTAGPDLYTDHLDIVSDYNCFSSEGFNTIKYTAANWYTLAQWQAASGEDAHSLEEDPLLTNAAGGDFTLSSLSPCINTGVNLGASYDDALHPGSVFPTAVVTADQDSYGSGWEMGAYVYPVQSMAGTIASTSTLTGNMIVTTGDPVPEWVTNFSPRKTISLKKLYKK